MSSTGSHTKFLTPPNRLAHKIPDTSLQPGYYGGLYQYPFHNPVKGGMSWIGNGRACNTLTGWFVIDSVTYTAGTVSSIDLRFEQHCEGSSPALHGKIHWIR
ncbi:MAG: hypothetical protein NAOJABEB_02669 [Steroidobacteraceae bacterium]|nr:hypothetical protein [Steroidobacteraceae bacterium]